MKASRVFFAEVLLFVLAASGCTKGPTPSDKSGPRVVAKDGLGNIAPTARNANGATNFQGSALKTASVPPFNGGDTSSFDGTDGPMLGVTIAPEQTAFVQFIPSENAPGNGVAYLCDLDQYQCYYTTTGQHYAKYLQATNHGDSDWNGMVWLYCENGPCSGEVAVNVGDDTHLERRGVGVNQRAMKNAGACKNGSGQSITSGECYCGPMSASGAEAMLGLVPATTEDI